MFYTKINLYCISIDVKNYISSKSSNFEAMKRLFRFHYSRKDSPVHSEERTLGTSTASFAVCLSLTWFLLAHELFGHNRRNAQFPKVKYIFGDFKVFKQQKSKKTKSWLASCCRDKINIKSKLFLTCCRQWLWTCDIGQNIETISRAVQTTELNINKGQLHTQPVRPVSELEPTPKSTRTYVLPMKEMCKGEIQRLRRH
jgi:hypothetical protein